MHSSFSLSTATYSWNPILPTMQVRRFSVIKHPKLKACYIVHCAQARKTDFTVNLFFQARKAFCQSHALYCHTAVESMQLFAEQKKTFLFTFSRLVLVFIPTYLVCRKHFLGSFILPFHCHNFNLQTVPTGGILRNNLYPTTGIFRGEMSRGGN